MGRVRTYRHVTGIRMDVEVDADGNAVLSEELLHLLLAENGWHERIPDAVVPALVEVPVPNLVEALHVHACWKGGAEHVTHECSCGQSWWARGAPRTVTRCLAVSTGKA